jgi:hypothetical protein
MKASRHQIQSTPEEPPEPLSIVIDLSQLDMTEPFPEGSPMSSVIDFDEN